MQTREACRVRLSTTSRGGRHVQPPASDGYSERLFEGDSKGEHDTFATGRPSELQADRCFGAPARVGVLLRLLARG